MELKSRRWPLYLVLCLTDFVALLVVFTVGRELAETHQSLVRMGLVGAVAPAVQAVVSVIGGRFSDRFGRRRMIGVGALILIASPAMVLAWDAYYLAYLFSGIAMGLIFPSAMALLSHGKPPGNGAGGVSHTLLLYCMAWNAGMLSAHAGGGWLYGLGRQWPLIVGICAGCLSFIATFAYSKPMPATAATPTLALDLRIRRRAAAFVRLAWIANLGGTFALSMVFNLLPKLMVEMKVPSTEHGLMIAMMRLVVIVSYLLMWRFTFWHFRFPLALVAQATAACAMLLIAMSTDTVHLWLAMLAMGAMSFNYFASLYYSTAGSADKGRALASGIHEGTLALGFAGGSIGGGLIGQLSGNPRNSYFLAATVILILACVQIAVYLKQTRSHLHDAAEA